MGDYTFQMQPSPQNWISFSEKPQSRHITYERFDELITQRMLTEKFWIILADFFNSALAELYKERKEHPFTAAELKKLFKPVPDPVTCFALLQTRNQLAR